MDVQCPHCHVTLEAEESLAGMNASCPQCHGEFVIPATMEATPAEDAGVVEKGISEPFPEAPASGIWEEYFYRPSGKVDLIRGVLALNAGILLVFVLALIYSYAVRYIPFIYLNALFTLGFAAVIGFAAVFLNLHARNRNRILAFCGTGLIVILGLWFSWGFWVTALIEELKLFSVATFRVMHPRVIFHVAKEIMSAEEYMSIGRLARSGGGLSITGTNLLILWILEAVTIVGLALWIFLKAYRSMAFCEKCRNWTKIFYTSPSLKVVEDEEKFRETLAYGDFSTLTGLPKRSSGDQYTEYTLESCPCGETVLLTVKDVSVSFNSKGNASTSERPFVKGLYVTPETAQRLASRK